MIKIGQQEEKMFIIQASLKENLIRFLATQTIQNALPLFMAVSNLQEAPKAKKEPETGVPPDAEASRNGDKKSEKEK